MERSRLTALAKKMRAIAKELDVLAKDEPQLFDNPIKEKIVTTSKKNATFYIQGQEIIAEWAILFKKKYGTDPIVHKKWVFMIAPILARQTHTKHQIIQALKNYFADESAFLHDQVRYAFPQFIFGINKYLAVKSVERQEVYE